MENFAEIQTIQQAILSDTYTLPQRVRHYLGRIEELRHLNAFNTVFTDSALAQAEAIQVKIKNGTAGKLAGLVIGIKDNICYQNHRVTASSKMLEQFIAPYSSTVVERLLAEDAIIIGALNCDEFAMGGSNETSYFGPVLNHADNSCVPGGSSGGSAVAVQAGLCMASLGTDTGGSVRQPAAFCGNIGLKPTYGRISRYGVISYASSFDQVGIIANSIQLTAQILSVLAGADAHDSTVSQTEVPNYVAALAHRPEKKKIAILSETIHTDILDPALKASILNKIEDWKKEGHHVEEISFDMLSYLVPTYYILASAEASSNLSRYDGVHYGYRSPEAFDLESTYKLSRSEGFGEEVKRRIMIGTFVLSAGYYDAYYNKAQKVRRIIYNRLLDIFQSFDYIALPVAPTPAFKIGAQFDNPLIMYMADIYTVLASLAGIPAISLPLGKNEAQLPLAIQLMSKPFAEDALLAFAQHYG